MPTSTSPTVQKWLAAAGWGTISLQPAMLGPVCYYPDGDGFRPLSVLAIRSASCSGVLFWQFTEPIVGRQPRALSPQAVYDLCRKLSLAAATVPVTPRDWRATWTGATRQEVAHLHAAARLRVPYVPPHAA